MNNYLLGRKPAAFDILYWNADATRMPAAMQSYYLRNMYLQNLLEGARRDNASPTCRSIFGGSTSRSTSCRPWRTTSRHGSRPSPGRSFCPDPVRFVLGASGHVAGVINPPSANKYGYWTNDKLKQAPDAWLKGAAYKEGSWWSDWAQWVGEFGDGQVPAREPGSGKLAPIERAPGSYVAVRAAA